MKYYLYIFCNAIYWWVGMLLSGLFLIKIFDAEKIWWIILLIYFFAANFNGITQVIMWGITVISSIYFCSEYPMVICAIPVCAFPIYCRLMVIKYNYYNLSETKHLYYNIAAQTFLINNTPQSKE